MFSLLYCKRGGRTEAHPGNAAGARLGGFLGYPQDVQDPDHRLTGQADRALGEARSLRPETPGLSQEDEGASYRHVHALKDGQGTRQDQCGEN